MFKLRCNSINDGMDTFSPVSLAWITGEGSVWKITPKCPYYRLTNHDRGVSRHL